MSRYAFAIGNALKTYRKHNNLHQKEISYKLGISREYYSRLESGKAFPSAKLFLEICEFTELKTTFPSDCKSAPDLEMCELCSLLSSNDKMMMKKIMQDFINK